MRVLKRYKNRKLYDCQKAGYITLKEFREIIQKIDNVKVIEAGTKRDITAKTLVMSLIDTSENVSVDKLISLIREL